MDITAFTDFETDLLPAIATVTGAVVGVTVALQAYNFVRAWIKKTRKAASAG